MKRKLVWLLVILLLAGALLYFVPLPCPVDQQLEGIYWGTSPSEPATVEIKGTYLRYLLKNDRFYGNITYTGLPDQYEDLSSPFELLDYPGINGNTGQLLYFNNAEHITDHLGEICVLGNFHKVLLSLEDGYISAPASTYDEAVSLAHQVKSDDFSFNEYPQQYITITPINTQPEDNSPAVEKVWASSNTSYALMDDGSLYGWGWNLYSYNYGREYDDDNNTIVYLEMNDGEKVYDAVYAPTKFDIPEVVVDFVPGNDSLALTESGKVYTWGAIDYILDEIDGFVEEYIVEPDPIVLDLPEKAVKIFNGHGSVGLVQGESGSTYIWGWNEQGLLADGTTEKNMTPQKLELPGVVKDISCYDTHVIALLEDGSVYTWGSNYWGELGDSAEIIYIPNSELVEQNRGTPEKIDLGEPVISIAAGRGISLFVTESGKLFAAGANDVGQLAQDPETLYSSTPLEIDLGEKVSWATAGAFQCFAVTESGKVYGWGENGENRNSLGNINSLNALGVNSTENIFFTPQQLNIPPVQWISSGNSYSFAMDTSGQIYAWGRNASWAASNANLLLAGEDVESVSTPQPFEFNID